MSVAAVLFVAVVVAVVGFVLYKNGKLDSILAWIKSKV